MVQVSTVGGLVFCKILLLVKVEAALSYCFSGLLLNLQYLMLVHVDTALPSSASVEYGTIQLTRGYVTQYNNQGRKM